MDDMKSDMHVDKLTRAMCGVETELRRANSFWRKIGLGIMTGFGTVIGATIIVAITLSILSLLSHYGIFPSFNDWIVETIRG